MTTGNIRNLTQKYSTDFHENFNKGSSAADEDLVEFWDLCRSRCCLRNLFNHFWLTIGYYNMMDYLDDWKLKAMAVVQLENFETDRLPSLSDPVKTEPVSADCESVTAVQFEVHSNDHIYTAHSQDDNPFTGGSCFEVKQEADSKGSIDDNSVNSHDDTTKPHLCTVCNKRFTRQDKLIKHQAVHSEERPYQCTVCGKNFRRKHDLTSHELVHTDIKPYKCCICDKAFRQSSGLNCHKKIHQGQKDFKCPTCGKAFTQACHLKEHLICHSGEKLFACLMCDKRYTRSQKLKIHMSLHHSDVRPPLSSAVATTEGSCIVIKPEPDTGTLTDEKTRRPYSCSVCNKRFMLKDSLSKHSRVHSIEKQFICATCGKSFIRPDWLRRHQNTHTGAKPHKCRTCGKSFGDSSNLRRHERIHNGDKKYKCPSCDKAFTINAALKNHMVCHAKEKPYECAICKKGFNWLGTMKTHQTEYHSTAKPYICPHCGQQYKSREGLVGHVHMHTGAKPHVCRHCSCGFAHHKQLQYHLLKSHNEGAWYTCDACEKKFFRKDKLREHLHRHDGIRPYPCGECEKRFYTTSELKEHQRVHSDVLERLFVKARHTAAAHGRSADLQQTGGWAYSSA